MSKISNIFEGWKNLAFEDREVEVMAQQRSEICLQCEDAKELPVELIRDSRLVEVQKLCCGICRCPLSTKLRSRNETCPLNKW